MVAVDARGPKFDGGMGGRDYYDENNGYTYTTSNPAPTIASITPNTGTVSGGTSVTIGGTGFLPGATVTLGGMAATNVNIAGSTSITATTPAGSA